MGWWGVGVTDGDTPSDIMIDLQLAIGFVLDDDERPESTDEELDSIYLSRRELLRTFDWATKVQPIANQWDGSDWEPDGIVWQCMAMLYLEYQLDVPSGLKTLAIEACVDQAEEAERFREPNERREALNKFVKALEANDRANLEVSGLFWSAELAPRTLFD